MSLNVCTTFWSRPLSSLDTDSKRLETTVSRSMSSQVSLLLVLPTAKSRFAITFVRLVPNSPSFDKVGIQLAAECWLLLDAPGCRGKSRSSEPMIVAAYSCWKLMFLCVRLIGISSLSRSMQNLYSGNLGSYPVFGEELTKWPESCLPSKVAHGCGRCRQ